MIVINIEKILSEKKRSKYWLVNELGMTYHNLNKIIERKTYSIEYDTIESLCIALDCSPSDLMTIIPEKKKKNNNH